ncbi:hypothetical protein GY45DRAFT_1368712 [Cubamyces sp. BRFM 1775]|nr:hypothetical protein GY45DRAFT_1368712 [Cubamyces sp. BRFM 1775]
MSDLVSVDNFDFSHYQYNDSPDGINIWEPDSPPNDPNIWSRQLEAAQAPGLSVIFSFTGSQVFVYGRLQPAVGGDQPPLSLYSIGDTKFQAFPAPNVSAAMDNVSFFNSSVLPYGQHSLIINVTRASQNAPFLLDYIQYNITDPNAAPASSTSSSSSAGATTTNASPASHSSSSTPVGAIVGGVIAGVAVIAAAIIAFMCYRMRRRRPTGAPLSPLDPATPSASRITPYVVPSNAGSQSHFSEVPSVPYGAPPAMRQFGSTYSLGTTATGEPSKGQLSSKAARAAGHSQQYSTAGSAYAGSSAGDRSTYHDGAGPAGRAASSVAGGTQYTRTHSSHSPMSSVHDLPNFVPRGQGHTKGVRSESASLLGAGPGAGGSAVGVGSTNAQADSGLRFEPGVTPSDVAPVLPPGAAPIRSTATMSEVARADIPPAYTPD